MVMPSLKASCPAPTTAMVTVPISTATTQAVADAINGQWNLQAMINVNCLSPKLVLQAQGSFIAGKTDFTGNVTAPTQAKGQDNLEPMEMESASDSTKGTIKIGKGGHTTTAKSASCSTSTPTSKRESRTESLATLEAKGCAFSQERSSAGQHTTEAGDDWWC